MTAAPLLANNPTEGGNERKGGNSIAIIGGVVAFICVALMVIIVIVLILTIIMKKRRKDLSRNAGYLMDNNLYLDDNKTSSATNPCHHSKEHDGKEALSQHSDTVAVDATYSVITPQATTVICEEGDGRYENMSGGQGNESVYETIASEI
ncbi:PREDICTED: uncharacterized protein LOC109592766 [Amphimedon queenslandica]|nr:PREDICTED: uncharacterized protein LOC109592766 [Amphimedon queenslandica]|eukprot:XP_019863696.1 PREDICTED: uncharacterized protein LOC109592766 [Amphimedon queenslandica]